MLRAPAIALLAALVIAASGCGGGSPSPTPTPTAISVQISPSTATVLQGASQSFTVTVSGTSNTAVTWSVQEGAAGGTITAAGSYTAPATTGTFHVIATSQADNSKASTATITVPTPQIAVAITPVSVTLAPGGTQTFTATVTGLTNRMVNWTVQELAGGSVSNAGFYNAPQGTGFYHVVATSIADATLSGSATIAVTTSSGRFTPTGSMQHARGFHTASLLANGKVLMVGGGDHSDPICLVGIRSAEIYDPAAGAFTTTGSMASPRYAHSATLLLNGKILVAGGFGWVIDCEDLLTPVLSAAELYDPSSGTFAGTGSMMVASQGHTATLLQDGRVLVTGGSSEATLKRAELYNPSTGRFTATGDMAIPRFAHTATLLASGKVLIAGGLDATDANSPNATTTAELYNPATGVFAPAGNMTAAREGHTATLLASGRVLISGGSGISSAELYDPATNSFSPTGSMVGVRGGHTATLLTNGTVLVAGGVGVDNIEPTSELYDPATGLFNTTGSMEVARRGHTATRLATGSVLVSGGAQGRSFLATAELYK